MKNISRKKGVSLVETIIYLAIFSSLFGIISGLIIYSFDLKDQNALEAKLNEEASFVIHTIIELIENGDEIITPSSGSGTTLVVDVYESNQDTTIALNGATVTIDDGPGQPVNLTSEIISVDSLSFEELNSTTDTEIVKIEMTLSVVNNSRGEDIVISKDFYSSASTRSYDRN